MFGSWPPAMQLTWYLVCAVGLIYYSPLIYRKSKESKHHKSVSLGIGFLTINCILATAHIALKNYFPHVLDKDLVEALFWVAMALLVPTFVFMGYGGWKLSENDPDRRKVIKIFGLVFLAGTVIMVGAVIVAIKLNGVPW